MELKIFGHKELERFVEGHSKQYDIIYYTPSEWPELKFVQQHALESLHLPVDDIDHYKFDDFVAPRAYHIQSALDFAKGRKKLLVCCRAGVCRSSATAYIAACQAVGSDAALGFLDPEKHRPNRLIVYLGACILDDREVWRNYVKWIRHHFNQVDPSQGGTWPSFELVSKMALGKLKPIPSI